MYTIKNILSCSFILCAAAYFSACTDVVDIELDEAETRLVVDAWISNDSTDQTIRLTNTAPFFEAAPTPGVPGATVFVNTSSGNSLEFLDQGDGNYVWSPTNNETIGSIGEEFELTIELDEKTYTSFSSMNRVPAIDSIAQFRDDSTSFTDESIRCNFYARDAVGAGDTYWIKTYRNGVFLSQPAEINIAFDAGFSPGSEVDGIIFITPIRETMNPVPDPIESGEKVPSPWDVGDEVRVEIHSISLDGYFFLDIVQTQLLNSQNGIFAEPLANTQGNIVSTSGEEEVLGMFVVSAVSKLGYVVE